MKWETSATNIGYNHINCVEVFENKSCWLKFVTKAAFKPPINKSIASHRCTFLLCLLATKSEHRWHSICVIGTTFMHRGQMSSFESILKSRLSLYSTSNKTIYAFEGPTCRTCTSPWLWDMYVFTFLLPRKGVSFSTLCNKCKFTFGPHNSDRPHTRASALAKMPRRIVSILDSSNFSQQLFGPIAQINEASGGGAGARRPAALSCYRALGLEARRGCRSSWATCTSGKTWH
jgi:hypothetical protein